MSTLEPKSCPRENTTNSNAKDVVLRKHDTTLSGETTSRSDFGEGRTKIVCLPRVREGGGEHNAVRGSRCRPGTCIVVAMVSVDNEAGRSAEDPTPEGGADILSTKRALHDGTGRIACNGSNPMECGPGTRGVSGALDCGNIVALKPKFGDTDREYTPGESGACRPYIGGTPVVSLEIIVEAATEVAKIVKKHGITALHDSNHCLLSRKDTGGKEKV